MSIEVKNKYIQLHDDDDYNSKLDFTIGLTKKDWQEFLGYGNNRQKKYFEVEKIDGVKRDDIVEIALSPQITLKGKVLSTIYDRTVLRFVE